MAETVEQFCERVLLYVEEQKRQTSDELPAWAVTNLLVMELAKLQGVSIATVADDLRRRA